MTLDIREARRLGIPKILIQSACLDGTLGELIGWAIAGNDEDIPGGDSAFMHGPSPSAAPPAAPPAQRHTTTGPKEKQPPALPLYDRNGVFVRTISDAEARRLVNSEVAEKLVPGGWRNRADIPWDGVRLKVTREYRWDPTCITSSEMHLVAGEHGACPQAALARLKLRIWKQVH